MSTEQPGRGVGPQGSSGWPSALVRVPEPACYLCRPWAMSWLGPCWGLPLAPLPARPWAPGWLLEVAAILRS